MRDTDFEKTLHRFSLAVKYSDLPAADKCYDKICVLLNKNRPIPAKLLKEFFGYYVDYGKASKLKQQERISKAQSIIEQTLDRFSKVKDYNFSSKKYDFKNMISQCVLSYFSYNEHKKNIEKIHIEKEDVIRFTYKNLTNYKNKLSKIKQEKITHYKIATLSGFLTHLLEYKLTENKSPTNADFFTSTRNALSSKKEKGEK